MVNDVTSALAIETNGLPQECVQISSRDYVITCNVMIHVLYLSAAAFWEAKSKYTIAVHK